MLSQVIESGELRGNKSGTRVLYTAKYLTFDA